MENSLIEEWMQENTFRCPVLNARISLKQCEEIRSRPTIEDYLKDGASPPKGKFFKPEACSKCKVWEEFAMEKGKGICERCGAEFTPYQHGCVFVYKVCKKCLTKARLRSLKSKKDNLNPDKIKKLLIESKLWSKLVEKAKQEVREIEEQIVYELKKSLKGE